MLRKLRSIKRYLIQKNNCKNSKVKIFNYQLYNLNNYGINNDSFKSHWLFRFIKERNLNQFNKKITIFGTNGDKLALMLDKSKYKIFYTIENVHELRSPWIDYADLLIEDKRINLSIGFDYISHENYLRFPFWMMTLFEPNDSYKDIERKCGEINNLKKTLRNEFCTFISRRDYFGDRNFFLNQIETIEKVNCAGEFNHNDDNLKFIFNDNKIEYLKQFKFNLCPENSNAEGYVTEKLFDSFKAGCIPIYWGSLNKPEPEIINSNSVIFIQNNDKNIQAINQIKHLNENKSAYLEFVNQDKLNKNAPEIIYAHFNALSTKIISDLKQI